jgi:hypothetical protein
LKILHRASFDTQNIAWREELPQKKKTQQVNYERHVMITMTKTNVGLSDYRVSYFSMPRKLKVKKTENFTTMAQAGDQQ